MSQPAPSDDPELEFSILGPLEVRYRGAPVEIRREKERSLLAMLLLHVGEVVPLGQLAAGLWEDSETPRPPSTLRVHVSRLRQTLAVGAGAPIVTTPRGYALKVSPGSVDAWRFERLVADGRRLAADEPVAAADAFSAALTLWRGPVLSDLTLSAVTEPEIARLGEMRLAALEDRVDAELRCGRHHELAGQLEQLVSEHPLRERLWAQRMVALYRSGRQAEAIRAYEDLRVLLRDELGISPSPALQEMQRAILSQDPVLVAPELQGRSAPQEVGAEPVLAGTSTVRFPRPLLPLGQIPFAGRRLELDALAEAWKECAAGDRRVVLLAGEAGIGKTRLAAEVARRAHESGGTVLFGRCDEGMAVPFQPFVEAVTQAAQTVAGRDRLGRHAGELVRLVPDLARTVADLEPPIHADPDTERYRLFDAVAAWLSAMSSDTGVMLVLDDLHWSGKPTLLLLRHLARSSEPLRLLVIGTYRDTDIGPDHPISETLADLRRETCFSHRSLTGLDPAEVRELLVNAGAVDIDVDADGETEAEAGLGVWTETAGNPFFVQEILRSRSGTGRSDGAGRAMVPEGVRDVVGGRVARLSGETTTVLTTASVIGQAMDFDLLVAVSGLGEGEVLDALDEAAAAALLRETPSGGYEFVHGIVRSTLYESQSALRRARGHLRVGEALQRLGRDDPAPLAAHYRLAGAHDAQVVEFAERAGRLAVEHLAFDQAVVHYSHAVEAADALVGEARRRRCQLLIGLGTAQQLAGRPEFRDTLLAAAGIADEVGDIELLGKAVLANSRGFASLAGGVDAERIRFIEAALAATGDQDSPRRARLLSLLALELMWNDPGLRRLEMADEAVRMSRRLRDDTCLLEAGLAAQVACTVPDRVPQLADELPELVALAERAGDLQQLARACFAGAHHCLEMDRPELADRYMAKVERLAEELESPVFRWMLAHQRCRQLTVTGSGDEVERAAIQALEAGNESRQPDRLVWFAAQMALARWAQGRLGETVPGVRVAIRQAGAVAAWRAFLPLGLVDLGERGEAAEIVGELMADPACLGPTDIVWLVGRSILAEAVAALGTPENAARLYAELAPYAGRIPCLINLARPGMDLWLGALAARAGRREVAEGHLTAARKQHRRLGAVVWLAKTELELGRLHAADDDLGAARTVLAAARDGARAAGARDVEAASEDLLGRLAMPARG